MTSVRSRIGCLCMLSFLLTACDGAQPSAPSSVPESGEASAAPPAPVRYPETGPELVAFVAQRFPEKLAAGVSREERIANMEFLRDRIIEFGICGGMDIGWNMKRGGPEKSRDFVAWHDGRRRMGVDIAYSYDAPHRELQLVWAVYGPTSHYREYQPRPQCRHTEGTALDMNGKSGRRSEQVQFQDELISLSPNLLFNLLIS